MKAIKNIGSLMLFSHPISKRESDLTNGVNISYIAS